MSCSILHFPIESSALHIDSPIRRDATLRYVTAVFDGQRAIELVVDREDSTSIRVGNIYKGKIVRIMPGLQAAFVDIGIGQNGYLQKEDSLSNAKNWIEAGQEILVQIKKEGQSKKGPRLTSQLTIAGKGLVLTYKNNRVGVSNKIDEPEARARLKQLSKRFPNLSDHAENPNLEEKSIGWVFRTEAQAIQDTALIEEAVELQNTLEKILTEGQKLSAPALIHEQHSPAQQALWENLKNQTTKIVTTRREEQDQIKSWLKKNKSINIDDFYQFEILVPSVIEQKFNLRELLTEISDARVDLGEGAFILIQETEALTAIDVNSGGFLGRKNKEDTALWVNQKAAKEIPRQLRLRNISGLIVIDFMDLEQVQNKAALLEILEKEFTKDRAKTKVLPISPLGLVEMTRQRKDRPVAQAIRRNCSKCHGRGFERLLFDFGLKSG